MHLQFVNQLKEYRLDVCAHDTQTASRDFLSTNTDLFTVIIFFWLEVESDLKPLHQLTLQSE